MPEALAVLAVFVIAVAIYIGMWMRSRDPSLHNPQDELIRLHHQATWLEERIAKARGEQWGEARIESIAAERAATAAQLAAARARATTTLAAAPAAVVAVVR